MRSVLAFFSLALTIAAGMPAQAPPAPQAPEPPLAIGLGVNGLTELSFSPGMPLTFEAEVTNRPAVAAAAARARLQTVRTQVDALVSEGKITQDEAGEWLKGETAPAEAAPLTILPVGARFRFVGPGGAALPWTPRLLGEQDKPAVLDAKRSVRLVFVVPPEQTASLLPGEIRVRLRYDGQAAGAGEFKGVAESGEVRLKVEPAPANPTARQTWRRALAFSDYHLATEGWEEAIRDARAMMDAFPVAFGGYARLGAALEGKGDKRAALQAYEQAMEKYVAAYGQEDPPLDLIIAAAELRKALGIK